MSGPARRAPLALLALALSGCILLPLPGSRVGRPIDLQPSGVAPGRTTREDLLRALGQPAAVAAPGQYVTVPTLAPPPVNPTSAPAAPDRTWVAQADAWFALFPAHAPPGPGLRVYYWSAASSWSLWYVQLFIVASWDFWAMDELWALVDEERGVVLEVVRRSDG